ncbi:MAG TPA: acyltransferase [Candidatus Limnocylindrales bacterium]|nr:acyltransferase [Candidatus Limnocylindrales bacterium]
MKKRYLEIDMIRGIATLAMILIHTCYYFLSDKSALFIWKWGQFAVPAFIFCSSYLFFQKNKEAPSISFNYFKKRIVRLMYPYYIFLLFFLPTAFLTNPGNFTEKYIIQSILLTGGVSINWLVLLFIYLTIIFPLIAICYKRYKPLLIFYTIISVASSCLLIFYKSPIPSKDIMWLPWSVVPLFTLFFVLNEQKNKFLIYLATFSGLVFVLSYYAEIIASHNLGMYENKYPPTIYFLAYGILIVILIYALSILILRSNILTKSLSFLSLYSYSIYFIHYTILAILVKNIKYFNFNWFTFSISVIVPTIIIQIGINSLRKKSSEKNPAIIAK